MEWVQWCLNSTFSHGMITASRLPKDKGGLGRDAIGGNLLVGKVATTHPRNHLSGLPWWRWSVGWWECLKRNENRDDDESMMKRDDDESMLKRNEKQDDDESMLKRNETRWAHLGCHVDRHGLSAEAGHRGNSLQGLKVSSSSWWWRSWWRWSSWWG